MVHRRQPAAADQAGEGQSQTAAASGGAGRRHHHQAQAQELVQRRLLLPCNKGKACRFKRSCFSQEDDVASSAMLLLACVVCAPSL